MSRILFLSYDGITDPLGQSQVLPYLVGLSRSGYDITLISFEKPERFTKGRTAIEQLCNSNKIHWHPLTYSRKPPVLSTLKDLFLLRMHVHKLHRDCPFDALHCRSYITALIGQWMKRRFGVKWIFDMRGFWADERVDGKIWDLKNPVYRIVYLFFKTKEKQYLATADHIISLTHRAQSVLETWEIPSKRALPITVIPCCVDTTHFDPRSINDTDKKLLRHMLGIKSNTTVLSYVGSVDTWYMLPEMLHLFSRWLLQLPDSIFLFITPDPPQLIMNASSAIGISSNRIVIRSAIRSEMPLHISISDYSLFFIRPSFSKQASSPTKLGELMAMGVPVICNGGVGDVAEFVQDSSVGCVVDLFNELEYDRVIAEAIQTTFDKTRIREAAVAQFSLDSGVRQYASVYEQLIQL